MKYTGMLRGMLAAVFLMLMMVVLRSTTVKAAVDSCDDLAATVQADGFVIEYWGDTMGYDAAIYTYDANNGAPESQLLEDEGMVNFDQGMLEASQGQYDADMANLKAAGCPY